MSIVTGALDRDLPLPLYHQLQSVLKAEIESGKWRPDEQLPTETRLAESYGVSKITVRQALQELAAMGYIRREQGRGTFVTGPKFSEGPRQLTSFTEEMAGHRLAAASRVLEQAVAPAGAAVAEALEIPEDESVFILKRLRLAGGEPMGIQTAHIPLAAAPGLPQETFDNISLYDLLQTKYGVHLEGARESYQATLAGEQ